MAKRVIAAHGGSVHGTVIAVFGLTFKPETDDMRDAPSIPVVHRLIEAGAKIRAFDPVGMEQAKLVLPDAVTYCADALDAAAGADILVVMTEWNEFRAIAPARLAGLMRGRLVMDLRNIYEPERMREAGFVYHGIARGSVEKG